jgi:hypothetical protein
VSILTLLARALVERDFLKTELINQYAHTWRTLARICGPHRPMCWPVLQYPLGELSSMLNESTQGAAEDNWFKTRHPSNEPD